MKVCRHCGAEMIRPAGVAVKVYAKRRFCSHTCHRLHIDSRRDRGPTPHHLVLPSRPHPAYQELWKLANPSKYEAYKRKSPTYRRKQYYGLTADQFGAMLLEQGGKCSICGDELHFETRNGCNVDHDHVTGEVRALLCCGCNAGLGNYRENVEFLRKAIAYLERHDPKCRAR